MKKFNNIFILFCLFFIGLCYATDDDDQEYYYVHPYAHVAESRGSYYTNHTVLTIKFGKWHDYKMKERIGKGKFSVVYRGIHLPSKQEVAMKFLIFPVEDDRIKREINVMNALRGISGIVQLLDVIQEPKYNITVLVMNYIEQYIHYKELFEKFEDWDIRYYVYRTLQALDEMHSQGLIHRDLKPLNIVYDEFRLDLNICDLGTAEFYIPSIKRKTKVGTKQYKSPELLVKKSDYDFSLDIWAVGVTLASCVFQTFPFFHADDDHDQFENIVELVGTEEFTKFVKKYDLKLSQAQKKALTEFSSPMQWKEFQEPKNQKFQSLELWDLLDKLLSCDPQKRLTAKEALNHPYFIPIVECWSHVE